MTSWQELAKGLESLLILLVTEEVNNPPLPEIATAPTPEQDRAADDWLRLFVATAERPPLPKSLKSLILVRLRYACAFVRQASQLPLPPIHAVTLEELFLMVTVDRWPSFRREWIDDLAREAQETDLSE